MTDQTDQPSAGLFGRKKEGIRKMSKRRQKSLDAAEEGCRAFRKAVSYAATQDYYMRVALDWLIWTADPIIPKKRR